MGLVTGKGEPEPAFAIFQKWAFGDQVPTSFHPNLLPYNPIDYANDVEAIGKLYQSFTRVNGGASSPYCE